MQREDVGREILALERRFWDAVKDRDPETAASLSDEPCVVVSCQGVGEIDKATLAKMMEADRSRINDYKFDDVHVRNITDDVVVVAYKVKEDLMVDGEKIELEASDSSIWVRRNSHWVCAAHSESIVGDPYGRH